jgi:hypothetical protein
MKTKRNRIQQAQVYAEIYARLDLFHSPREIAFAHGVCDKVIHSRLIKKYVKAYITTEEIEHLMIRRLSR